MTVLIYLNLMIFYLRKAFIYPSISFASKKNAKKMFCAEHFEY